MKSISYLELGWIHQPGLTVCQEGLQARDVADGRPQGCHLRREQTFWGTFLALN